MAPIDLRSDTVTRPSARMRQAMAEAEVGDDVYGEDPTVAALEQRVAEMLGKESALFVPSGTMANQIAISLATRRGDEIVVGEGAHCQWFESGAAAALSGVQIAVAGRGGLFDAADLEAEVKAPAYWLPRTALVAIENTHNRGGGRIFPQDAIRRIAELARSRGLGLHLDGARLWNAHIATRLALSELADPFDSVSVCFSKGLGAPVGSALVGSANLVDQARRMRRMLGGAMRQSGILAAAALFALSENLGRLAEDHDNARRLATIVAGARGATVDLERVETNIVNVLLERAPAEQVIATAAEHGVLVGSIAPRSLRLVTHLDVSTAEAERAGAVLARSIEAID